MGSTPLCKIELAPPEVLRLPNATRKTAEAFEKRF
jgi:hypothetical protein